jgi:Domain of unknown function (DUF4062)/AAA domain
VIGDWLDHSLALEARRVAHACACLGCGVMTETDVIRTPDQRLRVFVSSTLRELAAERQAVRDAVERLRLVPVMFELGARSHPPRHVYRSYLAQSQVFVGVYWQSYGWVAPGEHVSGLEDEYLLSAGLPRLIYVKSPAPEREPRLAEMLARITDDSEVSYQRFSAADELQRLVENDLAVLLSERFERASSRDDAAEEVSLAGALPVPATPLVGRDREAAAVADLVRGKGVRLITLTGPGGVGKSRLAVEIAQRLAQDFEDGVRFVELASVSTAELVSGAIAAALGLTTSTGRLIADLKTYLHGRRLLLVLDNFEQVTAAAPLVADLLSAAAGVVVLVTSRTVLRLSGEHEFPVPQLPVPPGAEQDAGGVQRYPSVRLFVERAQAASADFELDSVNAGAVAEICRKLDGPCGRECRRRPRLGTNRASPTTSRRWPRWPACSTTRSAPCACWPPRARSCRLRAAAGCTRSCRAPGTTMACSPRCAPARETRPSSKPGRAAGPWGALTPWRTRWRKPRALISPGPKKRQASDLTRSAPGPGNPPRGRGARRLAGLLAGAGGCGLLGQVGERRPADVDDHSFDGAGEGPGALGRIVAGDGLGSGVADDEPAAAQPDLARLGLDLSGCLILGAKQAFTREVAHE